MLTRASEVAALVAFLHSQLVILISAQFTNSTINLSSSRSTTGALATHYGTNLFGVTEECLGPSAPPGLSFPIETVVEKLAEVTGPTTAVYGFNDEHGEITEIPWTATGATTLYTTFTRQLKPQWDRNDMYPLPKCCGQCTVYFSLVDMMYWPVPGANTACLDSSTNAGVNSAIPTISTSNNSISTTIGPDGFTYTSPSIYVAYHDISASNSCGQVGSKHTSITLSFEPGHLSTIDYSPGLFGFGGNPGLPKSFDLKNLPCPPQSLIDAQESANQPGLSLPARGTYAPIIAPPLAIQSLDPAWKTCFSFYAFDPPKTLEPAVAMVASPTPAKQADAQVMPAMPRSTVNGLPVQTPTASATVEVDPPSKSTYPKGAVDPTNPQIHSSDNLLSESGTQNPPSVQKVSNKPIESSANPKIDVSPADDPQSKPNESSYKAPLQSMGPPVAIDSHTLISLPSGGFATAVSILQANDPVATISGTPVSIGNSGPIEGSVNVNTPSSNADYVFTAIGHAFTIQPNPGVVVQGNTLTANGLAATVSGTSILLASSGLKIGSQIFALPTAAPDPKTNPSTAFTMEGQTATPLGDSIVVVQGATLSINGPATTISGTAVSLGSPGLIMGSQTFAVPTPAPELKSSPSTWFIMGGQTVTPLGQSSVVVQGATLSINGPATTISGIALSLASSGMVIGGQPFALPTSAPGKVGDTVVLDGTTLTAGDPAMTIVGTPVSLVAGTAGLYIAGLGPDSTPFSVPVTAGESISVNRAGQLAVDGKTISGSGAGSMGLGSAIMLGFGAASTAAGPSPTGGESGSASGNGSAATGMVGFTGKGLKRVASSMMATLLPILVFMGWYSLDYITI